MSRGERFYNITIENREERRNQREGIRAREEKGLRLFLH
jgi:hypothetical protein